jgi:hypothetical protein
MAFVHAKDTYISVDADDLSEFTDASEIDRSADIHDVTTYGKNAHVKVGGLLDGKGSLSGTYSSGATGPKAILEPLLGQTVELIRRPEGTGASKPQTAVDVVVGRYVETNPVADMIKWSCEIELTDDVTNTTQA